MYPHDQSTKLRKIKEDDPMLFQTTQAHEALRAKVREFAENEIKPIAFVMDQNLSLIHI